MSGTLPVTLLYFAWVREQVGASEEVLWLDAPEPLSVLVDRLRARSCGHAEALSDLSRLRVAVNQDFTGWDHVAVPGDEVAIFPPVTGG